MSAPVSFAVRECMLQKHALQCGSVQPCFRDLRPKPCRQLLNGRSIAVQLYSCSKPNPYFTRTAHPREA